MYINGKKSMHIKFLRVLRKIRINLANSTVNLKKMALNSKLYFHFYILPDYSYNLTTLLRTRALKFRIKHTYHYFCLNLLEDKSRKLFD